MSDVADKLAIRELTARYNRAADSGHAEEWAATFVEDGTYGSRGRGAVTGRQALTVFFRNFGRVNARHLTTDATIEIDGDTAKQVCYLLLVDYANGNRLTTGVYTDELRRTPDGWRFVSRTTAIDPQGPAPSNS